MSSPATAGGFSQYPVGGPHAFLFDITSGADGALWFSEFGAAKVGRITTAGAVVDYPTPTPFSGPQGITAGPPGDANVWFTEQSANKVARITPGGAITEFPIPTPSSGPQGIAAGPDGNLWFSESNAARIGRITPAGTISEFTLPPQSRPDGITSGPDGNLWFAMAGANTIGRITPGGAVTQFPLPTAASQPKNIVSGPDGNLWFTMRGAARIGRITTAGVVTEFLLPSRGLSSNDYALDITAGSDGALWYSRPQANVAGRITTAGVIGEMVLPTARSFPTGITSGPDGRIWLVLEETNRIGALDASPLPLSPPEVRLVEPMSGPPTGGTPVTITGVNLFDATAVSFGDTPAGFSSHPGDAGKLSALSPGHPRGAVDVTVSTPRGMTATSGGSRFFYTDPGCGRTITTSVKLRSDVGPCIGDGLVVGADNIRLDLNGKRVFGFPGPSGGTAAGIRLTDRTGVIVHSGTVSDFDAGIALYGGRRNVLTNLTIRDNIGPDTVFNTELGDGIVMFDSAENRIQSNLVSRNGVFDGIGVLGNGSNGNLIVNNTVEGTLGPSDHGPAGQGIIINAFLDLPATGNPITRNDVIANVIRDNGSAGISNVNNVDSTIRANLVEANGRRNESGNGIGIQYGPFARETRTRNLVRDNTVRGNGEHGIEVVSNENRIIANTSVDNNTKGPGFRDLVDRAFNCGDNVWLRNTWGSAGFHPECVTVGGSGPVSGAAVAAEGGSRRGSAPIVWRTRPRS